jgi:D-alanine-D-alanine ligase
VTTTPIHSSRVLVLAGGPDAEHPISVRSAEAVAAALGDAGAPATLVTIDRPTAAELAELASGHDAVFPVLHGPWGEGGPLQDRLEALAIPYVGCGPRAARLAMDKLATKLAAATVGIATPPSAAVSPADAVSPMAPPVVFKPVHEGSSVGLSICLSDRDFEVAHEAAFASNPGTRPGVWMVERLVEGREVTVPLLDRGDGLRPLTPIEIIPAEGVYDYAAKYDRTDTRYVTAPELPAGVAARLAREAAEIARALDVRDLARADFIVSPAGETWLLEVNTMPGFTAASLLPKAAKAEGIDMPDLCAGLVRCARSRGPISKTP